MSDASEGPGWWQGSLVLVVLAVVSVSAGCGGGGSDSARTTSSKPSSATTTTAAAETTFKVSASDLIQQLNPQLPVLVTDETPMPLASATWGRGVFGGRVTSHTGVFMLTKETAFDPVRAATVRVAFANGSLPTPTRLLAGVGASLNVLSSDAAAAFTADALPRLSRIDHTRTTITVGSFYDLTVVLLDSSTVAFVFTPVGVSPPAGAERLGGS